MFELSLERIDYGDVAIGAWGLIAPKILQG